MIDGKIAEVEVIGIKNLANIITISRIAGAILLLFLKPFSSIFLAVYLYCGFSDMIDGYVARLTKSSSKFGTLLDSISDFIFIAVMVPICITAFPWRWWMIGWICTIAFIRFLSLGLGLMKYHSLAFLHTNLNKATGFLLFCFPFYYNLLGFAVTAVILCCIGSISSIEELMITIKSKELHRDISGFFFLKNKSL